MTILETFIKLRDDLKLWVTNNLNQKANISYVDEKFDSISEFDPTEIQEAIDANTAAIDTKVDKVDGMGLSTNDYTTAEKDKLDAIEANANFYEHPVHTSHSSGLYKVTVDESGHVSSATLAEKEDIVALGIPAQDTTYEEEIEDLSGRLDDVENDIGVIINEALNDLSGEFENYKETNNEAVSTNASGIEANKTAIEAIQGDYLTSTDKTQLQDDISKVSEKVTANASAIEILNGEGDGSVKQSIDNAFNEFAANVTNDDVVNTYKELIDYAAKHGPEFTELVGKVDTINTHVGEVEVDLSNYKTAVSDQFTEVDTTINNHVTSTNNPHGVTKEQVGLSNVDNTSDIEKPISNAMQEALDDKANLEHAHSDLYYDKDEIEELVTVEDIDDICGSNVIIGGGGDANVVSYATKQWVQDGYQPKGNYLTSVPDGYATESYVNTKIAAIPTPDVSGQINTHNLANDAHNDIRLLVDGLTTRLNTLADCDDTTLDQMSEVVEYIKSNQSLIEGVTTKKVNVADIIDNLTTNVSNKPLSAAQGVVLSGLIEELTSNLSNYQPKGDYLTAVPAGYATEEFVTAKIAEAELGGEEVDLSGYVTESEMQNYAQPKGDYLTSIPSEYITEKELENKGYLTEHQSLSDYATKKELPTKTSDLINDSGFLTTISVESVNGQTGAVVLDAASVGARPDTWMPSASEIGALPDTTAIPIVPDNISAFANDAGYLTEHQSLEGLATEEWVEEKFNVIKCSDIGMTTNDINGNNYDLLCVAISEGDIVVVDDIYTLKPKNTYVIDKNIKIIGRNKGCGFDLTNCSYIFDVGENCYQLEIDDLTLINTSESVAILFRKANYTAPRMNYVKINRCDIKGKVSPARFQQSIEVNPDETDIGVDVISITNNTFLNNNATCFVFTNVSHNILEVAGNTIRNMGNSFLDCTITNEHLYQNEIVQSMKQANIHHNDVYNDDTCFRSELASGTYYAFVILEGYMAHYHHNKVEGMKANSYVALYDAYLSCASVVYEYNYWKNNCVFDENCPSNVLIKAKGNAGADVGQRKYYNNTFITEKSFYEKFNAIEKGYARMIDSVSCNTFEVEGNYFDLYRVVGFSNSSDIKMFTFKNNILKAETWVSGSLCAGGVDNAEIVCEGNSVLLDSCINYEGVATGNFIVKRIVFINNIFKNCKYVLGDSNKVEELIFQNNIITNTLSGSMISAYGTYGKIISSGNKIFDENNITYLFNGTFIDSIDYEIKSTTDFHKNDVKIINFNSDYHTINKKSITVEFDGHIVEGAGKEHFKGSITASICNGFIKYTTNENKVVVEALKPSSIIRAYPKATMSVGKKLPFDVVIALKPTDDSGIIINTVNNSKIEMKTHITSTDIEYIHEPVVTNLPDGYTQLDYIETDGNQFINTGVIASDYPDGIRYVFAGSITDKTANNNYLFGSLKDSVRACNAYYAPSLNNPARNFGIMAGTNANRVFCTENYPQLGEDFILDVTCSSNNLENAKATLNGITLTGETGFANGAMPNAPIHLFECYGLTGRFTGRLYIFTMYDTTGNLIRNCIPCFRDTDNVAGLYDTVNGVFYENMGTGNFKTIYSKENTDIDISDVVNEVLKTLPIWEGGNY